MLKPFFRCRLPNTEPPDFITTFEKKINVNCNKTTEVLITDDKNILKI